MNKNNLEERTCSYVRPPTRDSLARADSSSLARHDLPSSISGRSVRKSGFTLIELLVVIGIIAILASVVIVALNPARQFAQARNTQRSSNVNAILNAIGQNMADNNGNWTCTAGTLPASSTNMTSSGGYNIAPCLVPIYLPLMPSDPSATGANWISTSSYNTGYSVSQDSQGRVTISAPATEIPPAIEAISVTR